MALSLEVNGHRWAAPDVETDAGTVERITAGNITHDEIVVWISTRVTG